MAQEHNAVSTGEERPYSDDEAFSKEHPPARRLNETPVLLTLAAILLGVLALPQLIVPQWPGDNSPEAGFARDMITHHSQAVEMADIVRQRTENEEIRVLATDITLSQQAEIGQMRGWLEVWGLPASGADLPMTWMGHPTTGRMPGMAAPEEIARLRDASPGEADEQFLRLMIVHHQAALPMAEAILERSDRPEIQRLAQKIQLSQQAEIRGMQALLQRMGSSPVEDEESPSTFTEEDHQHDEGGHAEGFTGSVPASARDTARLGPLPLAVLAVAWLVLDAIRRHRAWRDGLSEPASPFPVWRAAAAGGLAASAVLHVGLAPAHFGEATSYGVFFSAASVITAITAAAILAWPSRPAYLAGAGVSLTLIVLWAVFRFIPPPGAEVAEDIDLVGLLTKAAEMVAAISCIELWVWHRYIQQPKSEDSGDAAADAS